MGFFDAIKRLFGQDSRRNAMRDQVARSFGQESGQLRSRLSAQNSGSRGSSSARPRATGFTGLEAEQFAPLKPSEAHATIASMGGIQTAYLDSLSVIPDANSPRIQVIDRTMVGAGLITEKELAEIHDVGLEYDRLSGNVREFQQAAAAAVALDRQGREELKARKKAEAAARKQRHAEEVARRRATDIVFLGRGVSKGLADRRANIEKLRARGLQPLATPAELAAAMGLSIGRLRFLTFHSEAPTRTNYVYFAVPKKSGGTRTISAPHRDLKTAQRWVLDEVLSRLKIHSAAHGFVTGRSTVTNAEPHVGADVLINVDLVDFFGTITFPRVLGFFRGVGYSPAVATILALLTTEPPRRPLRFAGETRFAATGERALPQGAPTSPMLSNLIAMGLDRRVQGIAQKLGWTYTRYADDLSLSRRNIGEGASGAEQSEAPRDLTGYVLARLRHIAQDEGFRVNEKKTRVQRRNARQSVTGLVVNDHVAVPRPTVRRLRAILHRAKTEGLAAQNRSGEPNFEAWLQGMIAYVEMAQPDRGKVLREAFESLA